MGASASKSNKMPQFSHLNSEQIKKTEQELRKATNGATSVDQRQFEAIYSKLRPQTSAIFGAIQHEKRCALSSVLKLADSLLGDAPDQSSGLLKVFGTISQVVAGVVSIYAHRQQLSASDFDTMLDYLMLDAPSDEEHIEKWLVGNCLAAQLIVRVFSPLVFENGPPLHPVLSCPSSLFTHSGAVVISRHLPRERRNDWTLLFSSTQNGSSFSQMLKRVNGEGSCLVVVESTNNRIFGCFASAGFYLGSVYHGDSTSFLFEIYPQIRIYSATGRTENYAYLNCQKASLPNGLGIGGYEDVWPFFVHEDYGTGITLENISSFEKCHLSGSDHFDIKNMEVWRVGEKLKVPLEEECTRSEKSVIDKDPGARAMLEMSGRKMHSDAFREPAPLLDESFELKHKE